MAIITVTPQTLKQAGTYTSQIWQVPAGATGRVRFTFNIEATDLADPANHLTGRLRLSEDGVTFKDWFEFHWQGGPYIGRDGTIGNGPTVAFELTSFAGRHIRGVLVLPQPLTVGVYLERL
jgi:hypothetical protein